MATEVKDVLKLFIDEASFLAGSKRRQMGFDTATKRALLHDDSSDTLAWAVSDDSLQCLLAGAQTISGAKTFSSNLTVNAKLSLNGDIDVIGTTRLGDGLTEFVNKSGIITSVPHSGVNDVAVLKALNVSGARQLFIGGNTTEGDAVSYLAIYTANAGGTGTSRMFFNDTAIVLQNQLNLGGNVLTSTHAIGRSPGTGLTFDGADMGSFSDTLTVKQTSATGAIPVLNLEQGDEDKSFINFIGTIGGSSSASITTLDTPGAITHHLKVQINGTNFWIQGSTNQPT